MARPDSQRFSEVGRVAERKSEECFLALVLPPGFGGRNFSLPRAMIKAFAPFGSFASELPFSQRGIFLPCSGRPKENPENPCKRPGNLVGKID
jgi:hypothetical protein